MTTPLRQAARLSPAKIVDGGDGDPAAIRSDTPVLVMLAAGKGTRFGKEPKCVQAVHGKPLARHSLDAFGQFTSAPSICLVGYEAERVACGLGSGNVFVVTDDAAGGTALAAFEAFSVQGLEQSNPIVVVTMGDRIVPARTFARLLDEHRRGGEATLTMLTAAYGPPKNHGKGRIVRNAQGTIERIIEQRDIDVMECIEERTRLDAHTEGNCPLYAIRAAALKHYLGNVTPCNAQGQYYFTDIVQAIHDDGGTIRSVTIDENAAEYSLLCADVTRSEDLPKLECALHEYVASENKGRRQASRRQVSGQNAARAIAEARSSGQTRSIAAQLDELLALDRLEELGFDPTKPIGIGISGGRLRIAFMHPDMGRFFGPAWQMPIGAVDESGREQIVVILQAADDDWIRLFPAEANLRETVNAIPAGIDCMYPSAEIVDGYSYESFGTSMTQHLLARLGYYGDDEVLELSRQGRDVPDASACIGNAMRRPFALLANAIASIRTVRDGEVGARVESTLARASFRGLKVVSTGNIPQGGFSSSSAVTVAVINALDALFEFQLPCDRKVELACQAEYGTGVRAGALDQATEQKGQHSVGALLSSNPREDYRILGTYEVPTDRFRVLFPYTVDRDRTAWQWSAGAYVPAAGDPRLTAAEMRKMTGKASELAAVLTRLPLEIDFFQEIERELVETGELTPSTTLHVRDRLRQIPLRITQTELRAALGDHLEWYADQQRHRDPDCTRDKARRTLESLLDGWRDPLLKRTDANGDVLEETGAPLRAMVAYLYAEVSCNCCLIHHPDRWIDCVTRSQRGDRCFDIDFRSLPSKEQMLRVASWEQAEVGPRRMERWLKAFAASPFDFNRGIEEPALTHDGWCLENVEGTNFFRGLALIDLAEAMLKRAFGSSAVAVRVNGAGQGDYFQVHVDTQQADVEEVKRFITRAIYHRFDLQRKQDFVEPHPGGGAVGVRLERYDALPGTIRELRGFGELDSATPQPDRPASRVPAVADRRDVSSPTP